VESMYTSHTIMASWLVPFLPCRVNRQAALPTPLPAILPGASSSLLLPSPAFPLGADTAAAAGRCSTVRHDPTTAPSPHPAGIPGIRPLPLPWTEPPLSLSPSPPLPPSYRARRTKATRQITSTAMPPKIPPRRNPGATQDLIFALLILLASRADHRGRRHVRDGGEAAKKRKKEAGSRQEYEGRGPCALWAVAAEQTADR
jgi:hypothetical protein